MVNAPQKFIALFFGNQKGKTCEVAFGYVLKVLGRFPVPKKNVVYFECEDRMKAKLADNVETKEEYLSKHKTLDSAAFIFSKIPKDRLCPECGGKIIQHQRKSRVFRFCSETLPGQSANISKEGASAEVKNTQYPEFKKWLPKFLIKKDITFRNPAITLFDVFGGSDIIVEFTSYNQSVKSTAGVQRIGIWCDEESSIDFIEEQKPRLLAEDGHMDFTLTPANRISFMYDDYYEKACIYYRTKIIADKFKLKQIERTDSKDDICVIQAATDDNPTLSQDDIDVLFESIDDPDALAIRRYGIFKQVSGRIFKTFDMNIHVISESKYFPDGMIYEWVHARMIDYHEHVPWAIPFISLSPTNEAFIYEELNPSPEKQVTMEIAHDIAMKSKDFKYALNLIDPLSAKTQTNTGTSVKDDLNRIFWVLKEEGLCTGGCWECGDTKSTIGRDGIRKRLKNAAMIGKPFNNRIVKNGREEYLPTMWVLDNCRQTAKSLKSWRLEEWANSAQLATKDMKDKPQQKFSHFCCAIEFVMKDRRFKPKSIRDTFRRKTVHHRKYYQGRAHA